MAMRDRAEPHPVQHALRPEPIPLERQYCPSCRREASSIVRRTKSAIGDDTLGKDGRLPYSGITNCIRGNQQGREQSQRIISTDMGATRTRFSSQVSFYLL